ncbi:hypothetical protein E2C01_094651 [Portunus trituberculatus]|uniref:Uncharacterized protein n=1 Tax=Portunus trituberculatus TaxID=210409 RepID=A0A5B7JWP6_PORTR|nr:hypothetical protein [Portunus trituberculatus]
MTAPDTPPRPPCMIDHPPAPPRAPPLGVFKWRAPG